ncbi:MAG: NAD(P)H-dependent oxidoreductase [bacterium]
MKKLLHIIATPRAEESRTLQISKAFLETFKTQHADWVVEELDLTKEKMPELTVQRLGGKYALLSGKELEGDLKEAWKEIVKQIERFLSADGYLISTPMWNFGVPYPLKHYIDVIVQPKYLFRYTSNGLEGLVKNKKLVVIATRGGDYSSEAMKSHDFQISYLKAMANFIGITDVESVVAQPMDMGLETQTAKVKEAQAQARQIAARF